MSARQPRRFQASEAKRVAVPLLVGLVAPSGGGKTESGLRLGTGMQRVVGGEFAVIDTEAGRALHYADKYRFKHIPFSAPFDPMSYLDAVQYAVSIGATVVMIDSASHMHEGEGGTLEAHENEIQRLTAGKEEKRNAMNFSAWIRPKAELCRFLNSVLQLQANLIFCFRAKDKLKVLPGKQPQALGYMPIAGEEMVYEMTLNCLLYPNSGGVPSWHPDELGEKAIVKLPGQFRHLFAEEKALDEATGEALARWAAGDDVAPVVPNNGGRRQEAARLKGQLEAMGLDTPEKRGDWLRRITGRPNVTPGNLASEEMAHAQQEAQRAVAAHVEWAATRRG